MTSYKINIPGDEALLFSLPDAPETRRFDPSAFSGVGKTVFLYPATDELFGAFSYGGKSRFDGYINALCGAVHLKKNRGLPLSELEFLTSSGSVTLYSVSDRSLGLCIPKIKYSAKDGKAKLSGCEISWRDLVCDGVGIRITECRDVEGFSPDAMRGTLLSLGAIPDSVAVFSKADDRINIKLFSSHNKNAPRDTELLFILFSAFSRPDRFETVVFDGFEIRIRDKSYSEIFVEIFY